MTTNSERFDKLYEDYWKYVYEVELNDSSTEKPYIDKEWFKEKIEEDVLMIKVCKGY